LPTKSRVIEDDPLAGDVVLEASYGDWRVDGALRFPHAVKLTWNDVLIHDETRANIDPTAAPPASDFAVDASFQLPPDAEDAARGEHRSEWFHRFLALSLNLDAPETTVDLQDVAPGVVFVGGGLYNSLGIELESSIVVV